MKSVRVLSVPADLDRVRNIVGALNESDVDVFWDRTDPKSADWGATIEKVAAARAVVFVFSEATAAPEAESFIALAGEAARANKALCVKIDDVELPADMAGCTTYDLRGWRGRASSLFMLDLVAGVKAKAAGLDPPSPRAARQLLIQRLYIAVPSLIAAFALIVGLYRDVGADQIASPGEAAAWAAIEPGSCKDLRAFLSNHGDGVHADEAQALLASRRTASRQVGKEAMRPLPLYVSLIGGSPSAGVGAARAEARRRAGAEAGELCRGLAEASGARLVSATADVAGFDCQGTAGGSVCAAEGQAMCKLHEPETRTEEVCGTRE
jgi:hypothetical protein